MRSAYRSELEALQGFASRQAFILRGIHTSPLEPPCGGVSPFVRAANELRESALAWPTLEPDDVPDGVSNFLERCEAVADQALDAFEPLRTVDPPYASFVPWDAPFVPRPVGRMDWARFPRRVHVAARMLLFELHTTSRSDWQHAVHSLDGLDRAGYFGRGPLSNAQLSAVASLVYLARTYYALADVLLHWREAASELDPRLHFTGQHGTRWWELILCRVRTMPHIRSRERDQLEWAAGCLADAEAWIGHIRLMEGAAELQKRAVAEAESAMKRETSRKARDNACKPRGGWPQFITAADVSSVLAELGPGAKYVAILATIADRAKAKAAAEGMPAPRGDPETAARRALEKFRGAKAGTGKGST